MKKIRLPAALCLLFLFFAILAPLRAQAAEGWTEENGDRVYIGEDGNRVTEEWMRGTDNRYCWLDENGVMAVSTWADGEYYVDAEGHMVKDKWMKLLEPEKAEEAEEEDEEETGKSWENNSGAASLAESSSDSGAGTRALGAAEEKKTSLAAAKASGTGKPAKMVWYYFGSTGKAVKDGWAKIAGRYYYFDEDGVLQRDKTRDELSQGR